MKRIVNDNGGEREDVCALCESEDIMGRHKEKAEEVEIRFHQLWVMRMENEIRSR